jgi:diguanylate cyclase (GGDEF)-like protein
MAQKSDNLLMLVDDEIQTLQALERVFKNKFRVVSFQDPTKALESLSNYNVNLLDSPAIVLADYNLAGKSGLDFLEEIRSLLPNTIRCLFSGELGSVEISRALKAGVIHRFFQKPWDNENLKLHMQECLQLHEYLREATADPLTGLLNRKGFLERLHIEMERASRHRRPLGLLMLDLDQFKQVNDIQGHQAGDNLVLEVTQTLKSTLRNIDLISRYGGDEFLVALPDTDASNTTLIAERIRAKVGSINAGLPGFSVSIGVTFLSDRAITPTHFIQEADEALYQAKNRGKNRVEVYQVRSR